MRRFVLCRILLAAVALASPVSFAGTASGVFNVNIRLNSSDGSGICISSSLSQQTNALVKVTCQGGQFVSIEPREGRPFVGTHGGAFRFHFSGQNAIPSFLRGESDPLIGQGTITALRVLNLTERDERLELLVSF